MSQHWQAVGALCLIWPSADLNLRPPAPETNSLLLDQLAGTSNYEISKTNKKEQYAKQRQVVARIFEWGAQTTNDMQWRHQKLRKRNFLWGKDIVEWKIRSRPGARIAWLGGRNKFWGGHENFILCEFERGTGARETYPGLVQMNLVRSKDWKRFSGRNRKFKRFFRPKTDDLQKKRSAKYTNLGFDLHSSSPEPVNFFGAQSSLGGHKQSFGGARPRYAPPWRRVWSEAVA